MCQSILAVVTDDVNLLELNRKRLGPDCYQDEAYHLLTTDIVYYGATHPSAKNESNAETAYWPAPEEYDPHITVEQWKAVLEDASVTTSKSLAMLKMMLELGGESTCAHLVEVYGNEPVYYNSLAGSLGKNVVKKTSCPPCLVNGQHVYYAIPFLGRYIMEKGHKRYSWKLRSELKEALESMDLADTKVSDNEKAATDIAKNTILYGPPGTGKTYHTVIYAVAIIENKPLSDIEKEPYEEIALRYNEYKAAGLIEFTTCYYIFAP